MDSIPFPFDASSRHGLSTQLADGIRQMIATGRLCDGENLPGVREWASMLGVSIRVPQIALERLAAEGLVVARPRRGCVVRAPRSSPGWRGHVLVIIPEGDYGFYQGVMAGRVRAALVAAGYLVTTVSLFCVRGNERRYPLLELALKQSFDLAVLLAPRREAVRSLERAKVQYVLFGDGMRDSRFCVGSVRRDMSAALAGMVRQCVRAGVSRATQIGKGVLDVDAGPALRAAGIRVSNWRIVPKRGRGRIEAIQNTTYDAFAKRFRAHGTGWLPDFLFVPDDYQMQAVLMALSDFHVRVGVDVRLVGWSNVGNAPVCGRRLSCIESDPAEDGDRVARFACDLLSGGRMPSNASVVIRYRRGDTL